MNLWPFGKKNQSSPIQHPTDPANTALYTAVGDSLASTVLDLARPGIRLPPTSVSNQSAAGRTKLGGLPDLPDNMEWPRWNGIPLAFLAQFDLSAMAGMPALSELPDNGILSVFFEAAEDISGYRASDRGSAQVFHFEGQNLTQRPFPESLVEEVRFKELLLSAIPAVMWPDPESLEVLAPGAIGSRYLDYLGVWGDFHEDPDRGFHQLLGHPFSMQGQMLEACSLISQGIDFFGEEKNSSEALALRAGAKDWRLLVQIGSDEDAGMMWSDCGVLCFWIHQKDLDAWNLDNILVLRESA